MTGNFVHHLTYTKVLALLDSECIILGTLNCLVFNFECTTMGYIQ